MANKSSDFREERRIRIAQNNGVWSAMDFCCNTEEKDMPCERHVAEIFSKMSEALLVIGPGDCCCTISRIRFTVVEQICFFVRLEVEHFLPWLDEDWAEGSRTTGFMALSS